MRENRKYYLPGGYIRGKAKILCNGKIARGGHTQEAWHNKAQSSIKDIYERVRMEVYYWLISES